MLKYIITTAVLLNCFVQTVSANDFNETLSNNEASGYVNMLESFISKATDECKPLLDQNDEWRDGLIHDWNQTNAQYVRAVALWTNFYLTLLSTRYGEGLAQQEQQKILSVINMRGTNITREIIKGDDQQKILACEEFEQKLRNGELNVSDQSPHYAQLEKMIELYR